MLAQEIADDLRSALAQIEDMFGNPGAARCGDDDRRTEARRLTELEVRIPRLEVVALERVAARDGKSVDSVLARKLRDFVSVHAHWLSREVPGFAEAMAWPEGAGW